MNINLRLLLFLRRRFFFLTFLFFTFLHCPTVHSRNQQYKKRQQSGTYLNYNVYVINRSLRFGNVVEESREGIQKNDNCHYFTTTALAQDKPAILLVRYSAINSSQSATALHSVPGSSSVYVGGS